MVDPSRVLGIKREMATALFLSLKRQIKEKLGDPIFNRFDGVIKFEDLSQEAKKMIATKELKELDEEKIIPENVRKILVEQSTKLENAREIRKLIKDTKSLIEIREICK